MSLSNPIEEANELLGRLRSLRISEETSNRGTMDATTLQSLLTAAVRQATEQTRSEFQRQVDELNQKLTLLQTPSAVEEYKDIELVEGVRCEESLDIVKSVPEFKGESSKYVSWRQAAVTAHKLFEPHQGSSKYYQAVAILRNKIVGSADSVLSSYNTVLNFKAILARLDFAYSDKTSIYTLEQELSTLRQGQKPIIQFYNEVERKLTSIINKVTMSHEGDTSLIQSLNQKYRMDALRVFISGLRKPLCDTLFSCKPADMPTALALAQELETNQNRYYFASIYNNGLSKTHQSVPAQAYPKPNPSYSPNLNQNSWTNQNSFSQPSVSFPRPPFQRPPFQNPVNQSQRFFVQNSNFQPQPNSRTYIQPTSSRNLISQPPPQPMDVDQSMRTVRSTNFYDNHGQKRNLGSDKQIPRKVQRVNHLAQEFSNENLTEDNENLEVQEDLSDQHFEDEINFLEETPLSPISSE